MRIIVGGVVLAFLLGAAVPRADAGIFGFLHHKDKGKKALKQGKLPNSIDYPMVRPKVHDEHKAGKRSGPHLIKDSRLTVSTAERA